MTKFANVKARFVPEAGYIQRREEINARLMAIADLAEKENCREFTDEEKAEQKSLIQQREIINMKLASASNGLVFVNQREAAFDALCREAIATKKTIDRVIKREGETAVASVQMMTGDNNASELMPLTIEQIMQPLEEGLILDKVGLPLVTGLAGQYVIPGFDAIEAKVADEAETIQAQKINWKKLRPKPVRVGITIDLTYQLINQTQGVAYNIAIGQLPAATARVLNKRMFTTDSTTADLFGPFKAIAGGTAAAISTLTNKAAKKAAKYISFAGALPTYKELLAMKGIVLAKGVSGEHLAFVMDEYMKAELEATPRDAGSGLMIVEDGKIAGIPVFCTNYINPDGASAKSFVGFGAWGNELCQQFGDFRMVIDPYTRASDDILRLTLNSDWSMDTVREEAFVLGVTA